MNIDSLVRTNIKNLKPYGSARSLYQSGVFFDANENAFGSATALLSFEELNRYPDPYAKELRATLSDYLDVNAANIFAGNGSDEAIDLLIRIFVNPGEAIAILEPTYGMYRVSAETAGVEVLAYSLENDFSLDVNTLLGTLPERTKIIFLCSPNNPTGNVLKREDMQTLCKGFNGIVVVDEAYIEFASTPSLVSEVKELESLVVLRTLSKAWGMAGIRVGYAIANENVIAYLNNAKPPYNINRVSQTLAVCAIKNRKEMEQMRSAILTERVNLEKELKALGFFVFPSEANFLLVKYPGIAQVAKTLAQEDSLIIRDFGTKPMLEDCVRITVGTPKQNVNLIRTLKKRL
jgi:histidinol-phosphate aminotransferase